MGYCEDCLATFDDDVAEFSRVWESLEHTLVAPVVAAQALERLHRITHARIAKRFAGRRILEYYPTPKKYPGALGSEPALWWTFHSTGGVSLNPLLNWFSGEPRPNPRTGKGALRPRGGSTHFALDHDGTPWCFIRLADGAWHCRGRNRDSLSVEFVNACALKKDGDGFRWWRGKYRLPYDVIDTSPWRGGRHWQAYDERQFVAMVKLMRLTTCALGRKKFDADRTCQHYHFHDTTVDCGPLFPQEQIVEAGFGDLPLSSYPWIAAFTDERNPHFDADTIVGSRELETLFGESEAHDAEHANDVEESETDRPRDTMKWVQSSLLDLRFVPGPIDGIFGPKTKRAVRLFQGHWNDTHKDDPIAVDGIPGPITRKRIQQALEAR